MAVKEILMIGNQTLREKSEEISWGIDPVDDYIKDLADTLHEFQKKKGLGRAIAGPQIGYLKRILYMEFHGVQITMINPKITEKSREMFEVWDSCFSADTAFFGKTLRHKRITVEYSNESQSLIRKEFSGDLSELFQHELDHLDGVLFTDRIINNQIVMRSEWEKLHTR